MAAQTVTARITSGEHKGKSAEISYDFGDDLQEAISLFGEDVVFSLFKQSLTVWLQSAIRRYLAAGKDPSELATAKPGTLQRTKRSFVEKSKEKIETMSPEEVAELEQLLAERKAQLAAS